MGLARFIMRLCAALPRGGYLVASTLRRFVPGLRDYAAPLRSSAIQLRGDVGLHVFYPLAVQGYYSHQAVEDDILAFLARDSRVIADVGGNIGYISALLATAAPAAKIKVFEPLPLCQPYLEQVAAQFPGVTVIPKAVGAEIGTAEFKLRSQVDTSSFAVGSNDDGGSLLKVAVTTLDAEFAGQDVDLIKIDVEGFEHLVLDGARETLERSAPVIVFEAYDAALLAGIIGFFDQVEVEYAIHRISRDGFLRPLTERERQEDETHNFVAWPARRPAPEGLRVPQSYARPGIAQN